jgi:DNA-nicking Smr family endonuclease
MSEPPDEDEAFDPEAPVELPIDGVLDLHPFRPKDLEPLLEGYLEACQEKGIREVLLIHGKGTGALRRRVHALVDRNPHVAERRTASERDGGWGATWVKLR